MSVDATEHLQSKLRGLDPERTEYAAEFTEALLEASSRVAASDVHLQPTADGIEVRWRLDGVLQKVGCYSRGKSADVVARLKVLAGLLTYRTEIPQEGRLLRADNVEMRVSTYPTLHGERAVVRIFSAEGRHEYLSELGLPPAAEASVRELICETSGAVIVAGPAGSGKTTTVYACLREIVRASEGGKSVVTLEDPVEVALDGVAQSQVNEAAEYSLAVGLRSLMRQDPEVLMIGEVRDRQTAEAAIGASLTGHLVLTTYHAKDSVGAVSRLLEMGIEPYLLRSGVAAILSQRLMRQLCGFCATAVSEPTCQLGLPVAELRQPLGCAACHETGYRGRLLITETLRVQADEMAAAILERRDRSTIQAAALEAGLEPLWRQACEAVSAGRTTSAEVRRIFGFSDCDV